MSGKLAGQLLAILRYLNKYNVYLFSLHQLYRLMELRLYRASRLRESLSCYGLDSNKE
jgi:hypothetical protein